MINTNTKTALLVLSFIASTLIIAIPIQASNTFIVSPSGGDDTANIQAAFDAAVAAGPGSTVQLEAGVFYLSSPIVVVNFDGHFKGAGKQVTIVQDLGDDPFPLHDLPLEPTPSLFAFYQDDSVLPSHIKFSDMTVRATGVSEIWCPHGFADFNCMDLIRVYGKVTGVKDFEVSYVRTSTERMCFEGEVDDFLPFGFNVLNAFLVTGENIWELDSNENLLFNYTKPITGTHTITHSSFKKVGSCLPSYGLESSIVKVKGNKMDSVLFAFEIVDFSNTFAEFSYNDAKNVYWCGVRAVQAEQSALGLDFGPQGPLPELSTLLVSHNNIHGTDFADGVVIIDYAPAVNEDKRLDAMISCNNIVLDVEWYGGVFGFFAQEVKVLNNRIKGTGLAGIYTGVGTYFYDWPDVCAGWKIIGNNVEKFDALGASIWLGPGTSGCTVVGGNNKMNVLDEGTDNIVVGVNNMQGNPPGQDIKDAMEQKKGIIRSRP